MVYILACSEYLLHLLGIFFTSPNFLYLFFGWIIFCGLGSSVILHRVVSHNSIKLKTWLRKPLLFLSCLCVQGSPLWWAATHRGKHHPHADKDGDPHSPKDGFFHSYIGWIHNKKLSKINNKDILIKTLSEYDDEIVRSLIWFWQRCCINKKY